MKFENCSLANVVGMANLTDSLAVIKKLVFDDKTVSAQTLMDALKANWQGYEELRKQCLAVPKFGNGDPYVDEICAKLWKDYAAVVDKFRNPFGKPLLPGAISITAHAPGGATTPATPDGRFDGETLADGSLSPEQGKDTNGPLGVFRSGMKVDQAGFSAVLLNMKFHKNALKTDEDRMKFGTMVKTYLTNGGKQVQFNVVDNSTLLAAKAQPEKYKDLIVRVAGYSSYFTVLTPRV